MVNPSCFVIVQVAVYDVKESSLVTNTFGVKVLLAPDVEIRFIVCAVVPVASVVCHSISPLLVSVTFTLYFLPLGVPTIDMLVV